MEVPVFAPQGFADHPPSGRETMKAKVCLVGEPAVGKSSLVRRFVYDQFDSRYQPTVGTKVTKKEVDVRVGGRSIHAVLTIWDIMGEPSFRDLLAGAYFSHLQGVIAVGDVTRSRTVLALSEWIGAAFRSSGFVPTVVLGSKGDLPAQRDSGPLVRQVADRFAAPSWITSAKTGENVDRAFLAIADRIARQDLAWALPPDP